MNSSGEHEQFWRIWTVLANKKVLPHTESCSSMSLSERRYALREDNCLMWGGRQHQPHQYHHRTVARETGVRKISLQSSFFIKTPGPFLIVILLKEIAGQRSRVKMSSTWYPCTTLWSPMAVEQTRFCSPTKQAVTNFKWNVVEEIGHVCWHLYCTPDIKSQIKSSVLAKQLSQIFI